MKQMLLMAILINTMLYVGSTNAAASPLITGASYSERNYSKTTIKKLLVLEAQQQNIDPALVLAVAKVESNFDAKAVSPVGAVGVMQIMPATARNEFGIAEYQLYDPRINIRTGVSFLKQLINSYHGRVDIALSHYNGGSAVKRHGRLRIIPATQHYVDRVLLTQDYFSRRFDYRSRPLQIAYNNPRLRALQRLRQHNLNRSLTKHRYQQLDLDTNFSNSELTKREKVKRWESIY